MINITVTQRVQAGIRYLDEREQCCVPPCGINSKNVVPRDWRAKINAYTLNIGSVDDCILGQIYGDYNSGYSALSFAKSQAANLGFCSGYGPAGTWVNDEQLTAEWLKQLGLTKTPKFELKSGLVVKSKLALVGLKLVRKAEGDSYNSHWAAIRGNIKDGKFEPLKDDEGRESYGMLRPDTILENYAPLAPVFKKGDVLKDSNGVFYIVDESLSLWKLSTDDGSTYAAQDYWEKQYGVTFELYTTSGGQPLGDRIN